MEFKIIFCADGVMRISNFIKDDKMEAVPMTYLQKSRGLQDMDFWFEWWENDVFFEDGLTFGKFLQSLSPWEDFFGRYLKLDLSAYIKESKKLTDVNSVGVQYDWITITNYLRIFPTVKYNYDLTKNISEILMDTRKLEILPYWESGSEYYISGYKYNTEDHYSVEHTNLNELSNCPLYLNRYQLIMIEDLELIKNCSDRSIFDHKGYGMHFVNEDGKFPYVMGEKRYELRNLLKEVFRMFDYAPVFRDEQNEKIERILAERDVELNCDNINPPEGEHNIVFAEGAFDDVLAGLKNEKSYWDGLVLSANENLINVTTHVIKFGVEPEKHVYGAFVK